MLLLDKMKDYISFALFLLRTDGKRHILILTPPPPAFPLV